MGTIDRTMPLPLTVSDRKFHEEMELARQRLTEYLFRSMGIPSALVHGTTSPVRSLIVRP